MTGPTSNTEMQKYGSSTLTKQSASEYQLLNMTLSKQKKNSPEDFKPVEYLNPQIFETGADSASYLKAKQRQYQSQAVIEDVNNSDEEKSSTEVKKQNKTHYEARNQKKKKRRTRYNPARDPHFDMNSPEYINFDRRNSAFTKSELQKFDKQMTIRGLHDKDGTPSPEVMDESDTGNVTEIHQSVRNRNTVLDREEKVKQTNLRYHPGKKAKVDENDAQPNADNIVAQCKLKRIRFQAKQLRQSQIGGGKIFRQSQIDEELMLQPIKMNSEESQQSFSGGKRMTPPNAYQEKQQKNLYNKLKANSLSDIQDNSQEENDEDEMNA